MHVLDFEKFSHEPPISFATKQVGFVDFCKSNEEFFDEYFKDSVKISTNMNCQGAVEISPYGTAVVLREIMLFVGGRSTVNIDVNFSKTAAYLDVSWQNTQEPSDELKEMLSYIAKNSNVIITKDASVTMDLTLSN